MAFHTQNQDLSMYYVIQVATGQEEKVIEDIRRFNTNRSESFDVFTPSRKTMRKYKGVYKEVTERCFPGYIFVETNDVQQLFKDLYWVPDFTRLLGRERKETHLFVSLNKEESRMVDILYNRENDRTTGISDIEIEEGDKIRILTGPLRDLEGCVKKVNLHKRKVTVELTFMKRPVEVDVGINIVTK